MLVTHLGVRLPSQIRMIQIWQRLRTDKLCHHQVVRMGLMMTR